MSLPPVVDLDTLLSPFEGDSPTGPDPREDSTAQSLYYRVKDARTAARAAERANVDPDAPLPESWALAMGAGLGLLGGESKDLEVAAWTTEALVRIEGFAGLRDGLRLLSGLVEGYWDNVHPLPDEDGVEGRLTAVAALSGAGAVGTLAQTLRTLPVVGLSRPYSIWNYDQAAELEKLTDTARRDARIAAGTPTMKMFLESLAETTGKDLHETVVTAEEALEALGTLSEALDQAAGYDAPSFSSLRQLLEHISGSIRHFGAEKLAAHARTLEQAASIEAASALAQHAEPSRDLADEFAGGGVGRGAATVVFSNSGAAVQTSGFANREQALNAILKLADHFRRTEPQAPISYTLTEAVRRARMPLLELLQELTNDASSINRFTLAAGMRIDSRGEVSHTQPFETVPPYSPVDSNSYAENNSQARSEDNSYGETSFRSSDGW